MIRTLFFGQTDRPANRQTLWFIRKLHFQKWIRKLNNLFLKMFKKLFQDITYSFLGGSQFNLLNTLKGGVGGGH